jgi:hypothetical protein
MKYATVKDVMASFPHPVLPTVQGEPDYQPIHATRKFLQANSRAINTHLGSGTLGHLGLIISDASYAMIAPTTYAGPTLWTTPQAPGRAPSNTDGTAAQISAARHIWEEDVQTYRTCTSVQQALKKKIISVFEPIYLDILNDNMVGYAIISARDMLDHLFKTYGNITAVDLEINFEHMRRAWDPQQPVESLFKQIQDCADYSEAGGVLIGHPQQINGGYAKIFATGHFMTHVVGGTRNIPSKKLGRNSNLILQPLTVNTSKCRENQLPQLVTTLQMTSLPTMRIRWIKQTLEHYTILQQQPQRTEVWWKLSHKPIPVLPSSWRTTQMSCGNSRLYSRRNAVKSVSNAASNPHP